MPNRSVPFTLYYTVERPPIRQGSRWIFRDAGRAICDVMPAGDPITLRGTDFGLAKRQLRRLWERRPRKLGGRPVRGFWLLGPYKEIAFCYVKFGQWESISPDIEGEYVPEYEEVRHP